MILRDPEVEIEFEKKSDDPMVNFINFLKDNGNKTTLRQYPLRLKFFFDGVWTTKSKDNEGEHEFVILKDKIEDQAREFVRHYNEKGSEWVKSAFLKMVRVHKQRVEKGEIVEGTIFNYYKAGRRFCDSNEIKVDDWSSISRRVPTGRKASDDRAPTEEEIKQIAAYPDRRIKGIVYTMLSSGIRRSSWGYIRWKHIEPYKDETGKVLCAKLTAYNIKRKGRKDKWYYTFITPEAYNALLEYKQYREKQGEIVDGDSGVMVHKDDPTKSLTPQGVKIIIERAAQKAKIFKPLIDGKKRREWQLTHGFRKFFKTKASEAMDHLIVEMCLDHDTGLAESYYKAQESTRRANYLKAVPLLTIEDANKNIDKITAEVTRKVKAGIHEQIRELTNKYALTNFKREIDNIVTNSKSVALEIIAEKGGALRKVEWNKEEQLKYFVEQMNKNGEEATEDQIAYIQQYLEKSEPAELYRAFPTGEELVKSIERAEHYLEEQFKQLSPEQKHKIEEEIQHKTRTGTGEDLEKLFKRVEDLEKSYIINFTQRKSKSDKDKQKTEEKIK